MIVRYNRFEDLEGTGFINLKKNQDDNHDNWQFYGNIFYYTPGYSGSVFTLPDARSDIIGGIGEGVLGDTGENDDPAVVSSNIHIYNNTIYCVDGFNSGFRFWDGNGTCYAYNNLFVSNPAKINNYNISHDYNFYYNNTNIISGIQAHDQLATADPCIDSASYDFRLKTPTDPGITLPPPFNLDMYGNTRGADGNWDRGAFEYTGIILTATITPLVSELGLEKGSCPPYPNPLKPSQEQNMIFPDAGENSILLLYNPSGELIRKIQNQPAGSIVWDGRNSQGQIVPPGVYIYTLKDCQGGKKIGKIAVARH
jgi:hypothetical protein